MSKRKQSDRKSYRDQNRRTHDAQNVRSRKVYQLNYEPIEIREKAVYTFADTCEILQVSGATLIRWIHEGKFPKSRIGRGYRFLGSQILGVLNNTEMATSTPASEPAKKPDRRRRENQPDKDAALQEAEQILANVASKGSTTSAPESTDDTPPTPRRGGRPRANS